MSWCGGGEISPTPGIECRTRAMTASTLWPGNCPPSPGFAPCAILICIMSALTRYSVVTPNRPDATCLIAERIESPFGIGLKRSLSSPPSPVLDLPPNRRIAERVGVAARGFLGDLGKSNAFDARMRADEIFRDEIRLQSDGVENLRAAIGLIGRNPHLRHHLQQALADRLDVALDDFMIVQRRRHPVLQRNDGLERQIRIDRFR